MQIHDTVVVPAAESAVWPWIEVLDAYPDWMGLVHRAVRLETDPPAWSVDLRARLGPLARSKRLRMERVEHGQGRVRFVRNERDGRSHGVWELAVTARAHETGTLVDVDLRYEGSLWTGGLLERTLRDEIERAKVRLVEVVAGEPRR